MKRSDVRCSVTPLAAVFAVALSLLISLQASALDRHWNSSSGGAFGNGGNWIPLGVPAAGENIYIDLPGNYSVQTSGSNFAFDTLHVGASNSNILLTVQSGDRLTAARTTDVNSGGKITVQGTLSTSSVSVLNGTLSTSGGLIDIAGSLVQQGGSTILNGGQVRTSSGMRFNGGTVSGGGTLAGNVLSSADFRPGNINGAMLINGSYIQNPVASARFQVDGTTAGLLNVNGPVTLTGTLQVTATAFPPAGTVVQAMSFNSHLGSFQTVAVPPATNGVLLQPVFSANKLTILAVPIPTLSITPASRSVSSRASDVFTVSIGAALASDTTVVLSSSVPGTAALPASVVIRRGETSAVFAVTGGTAGSATISASLPSAVGGSSAAATLTVGSRPAGVVVTSIPSPMVVAPGDGSTAASFYVLQNAGDTPASITLAAIGDVAGGAFYSQSPTSFTLNPGASQTIQITSFAESAPAALTGFSIPSGSGVAANLRIPVRLLVAGPPSGNPSVIALDRRIDVSSTTGGNPTGSVRFQNVGTGTATGLAAGDVPWITPQAGLISIPPGATASVSFTIDRTQRPDATLPSGSARCTLTFFYPTAGSGGKSSSPLAVPPTLAAPVAISDTVKPASAAASLPPLAAGEVSLIVPGVGHVVGSGGKEFVSDVSILNEVSGSVNDVQLFFTSASTSVNSSQSLAASQSLLLADAVTTVFGNQGEVGTLHLRSKQVDKLDVAANVFNRANPKGTYGTAIPVFRSNRGIAPGESLWISGIRKDATAHTNLYLQEVSGTPASVDVSFLDPSGFLVKPVSNQQVGAFSLLQMNSAAPDNAVFATVTNRSGGQIVAFATPVDDASGDTWAVADWSRQFSIGPADPQVIVVGGAAQGANNTFFRTDVAITNAGSTTASGTLTYLPANVARTISLVPGQSQILRDVVTTFFNTPAPSVGSMIFRPDQPANVVITSRTYTTVQGDVATFGTGVPTLPMSAALRVGESRLFGGLEDSPVTTISSLRPATFRTNFGMVETTRNPVTVRVSVFFSDGKQLAQGGPVASQTYTLAPNDFKQLSGLVRSIVGDSRETSYGDLHNVQVRFEVLSGAGAVIPFVTSTDNGTGDTVLRTE